MSEKIVEEVIKGQIKELVRGSVKGHKAILTENNGKGARPCW